MTSDISVIITAYNAEHTIGDTLKSVLSQQLSPKEILIMDDGSTDSTSQIIASFKPHVKLFSQPNCGVSAARNRLIEMANGRWIAFLDADDIWHPTYLLRQQNLIDNYPNAVVWFSKYYTFYNDTSNLVFDDKTDRRRSERIDPKTFIIRYFQGAGILIPSFCIVRADMLKKWEQPFDENLRMCEDSFLWYRLALHGDFVRSYAHLGGYRVHENSNSHNWLSLAIVKTRAYGLIKTLYEEKAPQEMTKHVKLFHACTFRQLGKHLMGQGHKNYARKAFRQAITLSPEIKSMIYLALSYMPEFMHPKWPLPYRTLEIK